MPVSLIANVGSSIITRSRKNITETSRQQYILTYVLNFQFSMTKKVKHKQL